MREPALVRLLAPREGDLSLVGRPFRVEVGIRGSIRSGIGNTKTRASIRVRSPDRKVRGPCDNARRIGDAGAQRSPLRLIADSQLDRGARCDGCDAQVVIFAS